MYGFGGLDPSERKSQVSAQLEREEESLRALEERMQTSTELTSGMKGQYFAQSLISCLLKGITTTSLCSQESSALSKTDYLVLSGPFCPSIRYFQY